ncbi:NAD-dependent SIR2 family protein deacetylase [Bifidobacterium commune]|nr:NAD-dependent SIR2 family protein deacetylase [Bifidobacterium commune]
MGESRFLRPRVRPDAAHRFLARLEREGRLDGVATMNIDRLRQQAGSRHVCEYWGDMRLNHCAACGRACDWDRDTGTGNTIAAPAAGSWSPTSSPVGSPPTPNRSPRAGV